MIVTGASGDHEGETGCPAKLTDPAIACTANYGYGVFTAHNATMATWAFKTVAPSGAGKLWGRC